MPRATAWPSLRSEYKLHKCAMSAEAIDAKIQLPLFQHDVTAGSRAGDPIVQGQELVAWRSVRAGRDERHARIRAVNRALMQARSLSAGPGDRRVERGRNAPGFRWQRTAAIRRLRHRISGGRLGQRQRSDRKRQGCDGQGSYHAVGFFRFSEAVAGGRCRSTPYADAAECKFTGECNIGLPFERDG